MVVEAGAFKQCTSLTRIHIPASMVTHGYVGESPAYPGIFAADDGHLCERDRKDRQVQNSPSAQKAGPAAITPSPAAQVVSPLLRSSPAQRTTINIEEYRVQIGTAYHYKYRRIPEPDRRSAQRTAINIEESRNQISTTFHIQYRSIQTKVNNVAHTTTQNSFRAQRGGSAREGVRANAI